MRDLIEMDKPLPGKATLGLFGPVPARLSGQIKFDLLGLIDVAIAAGWADVRACAMLQVADVRVHRWRGKLAETGTLDDEVLKISSRHRYWTSRYASRGRFARSGVTSVA